MKDKNKYFKDSVICRNCGLAGHRLVNCKYPTISLGILCYRYNFIIKRFQYLMVQRRSSMNMMEIALGRYSLETPQEIARFRDMVSLITHKEQESVMSGNYMRISRHVWDCKTPQVRDCVVKYYENNIEKIRKICESLPRSHLEEEWGIPKGRRKLICSDSKSGFHYTTESNKRCACREFCEETGLVNKNLVLLNSHGPLQEDYMGIPNNIQYRTIYYLAYLKDNNSNNPAVDHIPVDPQNKCQVEEIRNVQWMTLEEALDKTDKDKYSDRVALLKNVELFLKKNNCS